MWEWVKVPILSCEKPMTYQLINSLPNDNILDLSKLKALADNKINVNAMLKFGLGMVENIVGKANQPI